MTSEDLKVVKDSPCYLSFKLPISFVDDENEVQVTVYHDDKQVESFLVNKDEQSNATFVQKLIEEIENKDEGLYTISVEYKRQKYIHKIAVAVGKFENKQWFYREPILCS